MLFQLLLWMIISLLGLIGGNATSYADTELSSIHLEKAAHFLSPGGDVIFVKPGTYQIDGTEEWISLIPEGEERNQAFLLAAQPVTHTESLDAPLVLSLGGEEDIHLIALFLHDGSGLWVTGSYSGIQTRSGKTAWPAQRRFLQRKIDALRQSSTGLQQSGPHQEGTGVDKPLNRMELKQGDSSMNQSFSLQYLNLQQRIQAERREFALLSAILKTKHEAAKAAINNIR